MNAAQRTCYGCGRKGDKTSFVRLAVSKDGGVETDFAQKAPGRGVYLCPNVDCFTKAAQRKLPQPLRKRIAGPFFKAFLSQALEAQGALSVMTQKGVSQ